MVKVLDVETEPGKKITSMLSIMNALPEGKVFGSSRFVSHKVLAVPAVPPNAEVKP